MGTLDGGNDSFYLAKLQQGIHRFLVGDGYIFHSAAVSQIGMLRSYTRIIQSCGDGMGKLDISIVIL